MADPTPPPPGPRRIRSLPDRPAPRRPGGGAVRSVPERSPASTRLPGTDAASYGGDMSWRRGVAVLWTLFALIAAGEAFLLAVYLLAGGIEWPHINDILRLTVLCGVFLALWFGWHWTRWVLAVVAFFAGGRTLVLILVTNNRGAGTEYLTTAEVLGSLVFTGFLALLGALYLALSAYLIFSVDVLAFTSHRRQEGRAWVVLPVALLLGLYWATMLGGEYVARRWLASTCPAMQRLASNDVQVMAAGWDSTSLATVLDDKALQDWPATGREGFMQAVRPLGTYLVPSDVSAHAFFYYDSTANAIQVRGECQEVARCTNGHATFSFGMTRPLFGTWRVERLSAGDIEVYEPPQPAAASPTASPTPSTGG